ncbi:MAG: HAD-IC family P-type ATPase, partial [Candidatus Aenigmatarchaeota archaeon]
MTENKGLSESEAKELLSKHGFNELVEKKQKSNLQKFFEQFQNFIIYVLIAAAAISFFVGEAIDAIAIIFIVILNAILGFVQEYRAEESLKALKKMASPSAKVVRDNEERIIAAREIVPGDLIIMEAGDKISADARIIESVSLQVDESSLTGESVPVSKGTEKKYDETLTPSERKDFVFMGTNVTYGRAKAIVAGTGMSTEMGKIAETIQTAEEKKTQLQIRLEEFGKKLSVLILSICAFVFIFGVMSGKEFLGMFIASVSLAVAAIPEGLPAIVTTTLALGVYRMSKKNAIVRKLSSVETLGSTTVICSDKTGTLTENQMTVRKIFVNNRTIEVTGAGYDLKGDFLEDGKIITPGDDLKMALKVAVLCNNTSLHKKADKWEVVGDPTEAALLVAGTKAGLERETLEFEHPRIFEFFFDSNRKRMSTIHGHGNEKLVFVKGAFDIIVKLCDSFYANGKEFKLTEAQKKLITEKNEEMAQQALRVLAVAYRKLEGSQEKFEQEKVESGLVFIGLIGMIDPPRAEVRNSIELCRQAGIKAVMITGDHKSTAVAVANELGMLASGAKVLTGDELEKLSDEAFDAIVDDVVVYARVSPEHKTRIVKALKRKNHVVAMTGDGVNDAPA